MRSRCRKPISGGRSINCARWWTASCRRSRPRVEGSPCRSGAAPARPGKSRSRSRCCCRKPAGSIAHRFSWSPAMRVRRQSPAPGRASIRERAFRNLPGALKEKYFVRPRGRWSVVPELHRRVSYDLVNLVAEDQVSRYASSPVIVCRNVFIYFSDRSIQRTLRVFERAMPSPAYLCVGRVGIVAAPDVDIRSAGDWRGVRVREGRVRSRESGDSSPAIETAS